MLDIIILPFGGGVMPSLEIARNGLIYTPYNWGLGNYSWLIGWLTRGLASQIESRTG